MTSNHDRTASKSNCRRLLVGLLLCTALLVGWLLVRPVAAKSEIKSDERVVFFPTAAHLSEDRNTWIVPIHGWIFEPEEGDVLRGVALQKLRTALYLAPNQASGAIFEKRARSFLVDNERGKSIEILIGSQTHTLGPSDDDGHFTATVNLSAGDVRELAGNGRLAFKAVTRSDDHREFRGVAHLVEPEGLSVISDVDDTIKVTQVTDRKELIANTFVRPFRPVDGMADLYGRWAEAGVRFHFVSSSPWQLYESLSQFMREAGFPDATFHLKRFRLKDSSVLKLFADPLKTKQLVIEPILKAYPQRQFILVGDSGEKDPEVYALLSQKYPRQIQRIYIRNVSGEPADSPRYQKAFKNVPARKWRVFDDPERLALPEH